MVSQAQVCRGVQLRDVCRSIRDLQRVVERHAGGERRRLGVRCGGRRVKSASRVVGRVWLLTRLAWPTREGLAPFSAPNAHRVQQPLFYITAPHLFGSDYTLHCYTCFTSQASDGLDSGVAQPTGPERPPLFQTLSRLDSCAIDTTRGPSSA